MLARKASEELADLRRKRAGTVQVEQFTNGEALLDFQVQVSPHLMRPEHFRVYLARVEQAVGGRLRIVFAAPPQHGKTECTLHSLVYICRRYPTRRHAYITYNQQRANRVSKKVKRLLQRSGVKVRGTLNCLELPGGGQVLFSGMEGGITGEPVDGLCIIDDPFKDVAEANSAARRELVLDTYRSAIQTRVHAGASILVLATRWHPEDLSGVLINEGWEHINLPAIAEGDNDPNGRAPGEPLFPAMWPIEELEKKREEVLEFTWAALYQGRPRPKGGTVFHDPTFYTQLPTVYSAGFGVDLAYTANTKSDWSICVELWRETRPGDLPLFYVKHVDRARVEAPVFASTLKKRHQERPGARMLFRGSGTEKGSVDFIRQQGIPLEHRSPPGDKFVSAQAVAAAWNAGRVLLPDVGVFPEAERWIYAFLSVVSNFTGSGREKDDDVDGLANAHAIFGDAPERNRPPVTKRPSAGENTGGF